MAKITLNILSKWVTDLRGIVAIPRDVTLGLTNECTSQLMFKMFLDYDEVGYTVVRKDLQFLFENFGLCCWIVLKNSETEVMNADGKNRTVGNYTVWGLDTLPWQECMRMKQYTRCDFKHKSIPRRSTARLTVNRITAVMRNQEIIRPHPKLKETLEYGGCRHIHCRGLYEYLSKLFKFKMSIKNWDNCTTVEEIYYNTVKEAK